MPPLGSIVHVDAAAGFWLLLLALSTVAYVVWLFKTSDYDFEESLLYAPTYFFGRLLWRVQFLNAPPVALRRGGAVLVANHRSSVDPFFIQLAAKRRVHWMVAREYCEHGATAPILRLCQVIPTNRSGMDNAATKTAIRLVRSGRLIGMFPEGQLNHTLQPLLPVRSGAALVALRAGVPIIPIWLSGSPYRREVWSPLTMSANVKISFGEPIFTELAPSVEQSMDLAGENAQAGLSNEVVDDTTLESSTVASRVDRKGDLIRAEQLILEWARRGLALGGYANFPVKIAGRSRLEKVEKCKTET